MAFCIFTSAWKYVDAYLKLRERSQRAIHSYQRASRWILEQGSFNFSCLIAMPPVSGCFLVSKERRVSPKNNGRYLPKMPTLDGLWTNEVHCGSTFLFYW